MVVVVVVAVVGAALETDQADGEADGEVCPVSSFPTWTTRNKDEAFFI